jgi:hypothetical protein
VGGHPDRLVDHHQVVVVVDHDHAGHRLGHDLRGTGRRRDGHVQPGAGLHPVRLHPRAAVNEHVAGTDQLGRLGAGEAEQAGQRRVQALAGEAVGHGERTSVGHTLEYR